MEQPHQRDRGKRNSGVVTALLHPMHGTWRKEGRIGQWGSASGSRYWACSRAEHARVLHVDQ